MLKELNKRKTRKIKKKQPKLIKKPMLKELNKRKRLGK